MSTENNKDQDPLEELLKFAGRREHVEPHRLDRAEKQLFDHWQQTLRLRRSSERRRRAKQVGGFFALAASVVLAFTLLFRFQDQAPVVATVAYVVGSMEVGFRDQPMAEIATGAELRAGSIVETNDNSGASLILASGHNVRVAASSRLRLQADSIMLDQGSLYIDSGHGGAKSRLLVRTSFGTVSELGTQYLATVTNDSIEVSVREGAINIAREDGPTLTAKAGEAVLMKRDGSVSKETIKTYGERWQWASTLGQPIELEGSMLAEYLSWISREYGWEIRYATGTLERRARSVELHGSIQGLSSEDALASVIESVEWRHTLLDGVVSVSSAQ